MDNAVELELESAALALMLVIALPELEYILELVKLEAVVVTGPLVVAAAEGELKIDVELLGPTTLELKLKLDPRLSSSVL